MPPESETGERAAGPGPLARLREDPARAAILTDVDGTLAPIAERPEEAAVPAAVAELLGRLAERYGLVGCVSGRRAEEVRRLVGLDSIAYAGNHGLELLPPGEERVAPDPGLAGREEGARDFLADLGRDEVEDAGLRREDKGPIQGLHWRGAPDEDAAERRAHEIGAAAERAGLELRRGRKILELGPAGGSGKDGAVSSLLAGRGFRAAAYAGDDRTDLDAFRRLRELVGAGELEAAVCVGVLSDEGPAGIGEDADVTVDGPEGWLAMLDALAG